MTSNDVAILGGMFDPVHKGHLAALRQVMKKTGWSGWLLPASRPAHKPAPVASPEDRMAMTERACGELPAAIVSPLEIARGGTSYTIDTLIEMEGSRPDITPWFVIGADQFLDLDSWHRSEELKRRGRFIIVNRQGTVFSSRAITESGIEPDRVRRIAIRSPDISSTMIRERLSRGLPVAGLVPSAVGEYIEEHGLYRA